MIRSLYLLAALLMGCIEPIALGPCADDDDCLSGRCVAGECVSPDDPDGATTDGAADTPTPDAGGDATPRRDAQPDGAPVDAETARDQGLEVDASESTDGDPADTGTPPDGSPALDAEADIGANDAARDLGPALDMGDSSDAIPAPEDMGRPMDAGPDAGPDVDADVPCVPMGEEVCNGLDDDCDGEIDDVVGDEATVGEPCRAPGRAEGCELDGTWQCPEAGDVLECVPLPPRPGCDGVDNDCDGRIDEFDLSDGPNFLDFGALSPPEAVVFPDHLLLIYVSPRGFESVLAARPVSFEEEGVDTRTREELLALGAVGAPAVVGDADGLWVAWTRRDQGVRLARFGPLGEPLLGPFDVSDDPDDRSVTLARGAGQLLVAWERGDSTVSRRMTIDGERLGDEISLADAESPQAVHDGERFSVAYASAAPAPDADIRLAILDDDGAVARDLDVSHGDARTSDPTVAGLGDGSVAAAWVNRRGEDLDVYAQVLSTSPDAPEPPAAARAVPRPQNQADPRLGWNGERLSVAFVEDADQDGRFETIFQALNLDGTPAGEALLDGRPTARSRPALVGAGPRWWTVTAVGTSAMSIDAIDESEGPPERVLEVTSSLTVGARAEISFDGSCPVEGGWISVLRTMTESTNLLVAFDEDGRVNGTGGPIEGDGVRVHCNDRAIWVATLFADPERRQDYSISRYNHELELEGRWTGRAPGVIHSAPFMHLIEVEGRVHFAVFTGDGGSLTAPLFVGEPLQLLLANAEALRGEVYWAGRGNGRFVRDVHHAAPAPCGIRVLKLVHGPEESHITSTCYDLDTGAFSPEASIPVSSHPDFFFRHLYPRAAGLWAYRDTSRGHPTPRQEFRVLDPATLEGPAHELCCANAAQSRFVFDWGAGRIAWFSAAAEFTRVRIIDPEDGLVRLEQHDLEAKVLAGRPGEAVFVDRSEEDSSARLRFLRCN